MNHRPLSPHLQIYRPQITSVLSILHRGTGIILAAGALLTVVWLLAVAIGPEAFELASGLVSSIPGKIMVFVWSACTAYHLCNGVRHLAWDAGFGFELPQVYLTGKLVLAGTLLITAGVWLT